MLSADENCRESLTKTNHLRSDSQRRSFAGGVDDELANKARQAKLGKNLEPPLSGRDHALKAPYAMWIESASAWVKWVAKKIGLVLNDRSVMVCVAS